VTDFHHITVLKQEVVDALAGFEGLVLDLTVGGGGHSEALLSALPGIRILGFDRDPVAVKAATARLASFGDRFEIVNRPFSSVIEVLSDRGLSRGARGSGVPAIVADLGVSSPQFDDPSRGFSLSADGPLDMRMGDGQTAGEYLDEVSQEELARIFWQYGDIRQSRKLARAVKNDRAEGLINTTSELAALCGRVLGKGRKHDPATLPFQALRIAVNDELGELETVLNELPNLLADGGRAAFISFHSLEDRRVKHAFRDLVKGPEVPRGLPITGDQLTDFRLVGKAASASDDELNVNPRARSARLRILERKSRS
jgi:16S rRNA (cytosine1402-N4)-methyltransferase